MNLVRIGNVIAAELDKLRTLPAATLTALGTILTGILLAAALAAADQHVEATATTVTLRSVPFVQVGFVLLGILPMAHEYTGRQIRVTLSAIPRRSILLAGKITATALTLVLTAAVTGAASTAAAALTLRSLGAFREMTADDLWHLAGTTCYLTLIGLISHAAAVLVRHLIPALVSVLGLILILSPLLAGLTEHARWLPDRAAAQVYDPHDTMLTAGTGLLVALAWIVLIAATGATRFIRRDP
ncbi:ABC-2 family transporter protein [Micromonospora sp. MW-13]|uniref:ABC transporter permease n=1 Tax=unclassified Micromonospora TaxID=2617518 RepID=UPI000E437034|nr:MULTISPECIES: ABC transporter permease [unclassified Micromonospora]MCX4473031.1 hypothetical protein [Micromonospora sp. NBC_01655]RGC65252.1 ABC-2 family transporter protein [Micromonospora sp. MW-13]